MLLQLIRIHICVLSCEIQYSLFVNINIDFKQYIYSPTFKVNKSQSYASLKFCRPSDSVVQIHVDDIGPH